MMFVTGGLRAWLIERLTVFDPGFLPAPGRLPRATLLPLRGQIRLDTSIQGLPHVVILFLTEIALIADQLITTQ
jgi:hypothetical protein